MVVQQFSEKCVTATVHETLPKFGLAYLVDDSDRTWVITRSTKGPGLDGIHPGQRCKLTLDDHQSYTLVQDYQLLS